MLLTRDPLRNKGHIQTESEGLEKDIHANRDQKKAGAAILISDKIDFKTKAVKRDKEGHYIMIKRSIQEEDITIINIYAPNLGAPQHVRQMLTSMLLLLLLLSCFSHVRLFVNPWITACQASLSITNSWSSLTLTSIESVMPSSHHPLSSPSPPAPNPSQH